MRNYNEIANSVFERRDKFETEKKNRRRFIAKTMTPICCFCLVALLGIGVWQGGLFEDDSPTPIANDSIYPGEVDHYGPNESPTENKIVINNITSFPTDRSNLNFELKQEDFVKMDKAEIIDYYGVEIFPAVPNDIKEWNDAFYGIYKKDGGSGAVYWDQMILNYSNEDFTRGVNIEIKKGSLPVLDYGFGESSEEKSVINNWEVAIGYSESSGYHALFMYKDIGFCVNAEGVSQDEFIDVISSILK